MVLNKGEVVFDGETSEAVNHYLDAFGHKPAQGQANPAVFQENPDKPVNILSIRVVNGEGKTSNKINYSEAFAVEMEILVREANENYFAAIWLRDTSGQMILFTSDEDLGPAAMGKLQPGRYTTRVEMPARMFVPDSYRLMCALAKKPTGQIDRKDEAIELEIIDTRPGGRSRALSKDGGDRTGIAVTIDEAGCPQSAREPVMTARVGGTSSAPEMRARMNLRHRRANAYICAISDARGASQFEIGATMWRQRAIEGGTVPWQRACRTIRNAPEPRGAAP